MTLRDKLVEVRPEKASDGFLGSLYGCPGDYDFLGEPRRRFANVDYCSSTSCAACWLAEYKEPDEVAATEEEKRMIIYIAGKVTGDPDYKSKFFEAAEQVNAAGHTPLNPATLPEDLTHEQAMPICMAMLQTADAILLLPDWSESKGARAEKAYADLLGKHKLELCDGDVMVMSCLEG